jgi:hypothetical protein
MLTGTGIGIDAMEVAVALEMVAMVARLRLLKWATVGALLSGSGASLCHSQPARTRLVTTVVATLVLREIFLGSERSKVSATLICPDWF